ncbi:MAG: anaerobic ribonucleoside-triphosphate reductase, partial [Deltaproteobacteria bacterium]|nr:anaerobic ribonucleoside-triphosphate reductase [Deltaproteobacteria bacterium]
CVVIGGEAQDTTYADFQKEMDLFNKAFLEVMAEGDARGRVFTFPIPTYSITKEFDWENPILDDLWEMTAKYGVPYFSNFVNSDMNPEDARSMCCRLRIDNRQLEKRGGGLFGSNPLTGSIGVVTINMPKIGYLSGSPARNVSPVHHPAPREGMPGGQRELGGEDEFFTRLKNLMVLAKESLEIKRKVLERFTDGGLYPYTKYYLRNVKKRFNEYWKNHFSTIGLVGMNEACQNFLGKTVGDIDGKEFTTKVLDFMRGVLLDFQKETGNNYNLEATPAEGTSYSLAKIDRDRYPDIISAGHGDGDQFFYTNSTHLPVNFTDDVFEALDLQDVIQQKYTGGTVFHIYAGERIANPRSVKLLVQKICENYHLPYFTFTPTFSVCPVHGYLNGEHSVCQKCGAECEVYSRVVGYLRPLQQWNRGKQEEFKMRKMFKV